MDPPRAGVRWSLQPPLSPGPSLWLSLPEQLAALRCLPPLSQSSLRWGISLGWRLRKLLTGGDALCWSLHGDLALHHPRGAGERLPLGLACSSASSPAKPLSTAKGVSSALALVSGPVLTPSYTRSVRTWHQPPLLFMQLWPGPHLVLITAFICSWNSVLVVYISYRNWILSSSPD